MDEVGSSMLSTRREFGPGEFSSLADPMMGLLTFEAMREPRFQVLSKPLTPEIKLVLRGGVISSKKQSGMLRHS